LSSRRQEADSETDNGKSVLFLSLAMEQSQLLRNSKQTGLYRMGLAVVMAVNVMSIVFWDVLPCNLLEGLEPKL
jgi:hypothetical protein